MCICSHFKCLWSIICSYNLRHIGKVVVRGKHASNKLIGWLKYLASQGQWTTFVWWASVFHHHPHGNGISNAYYLQCIAFQWYCCLSCAFLFRDPPRWSLLQGTQVAAVLQSAGKTLQLAFILLHVALKKTNKPNKCRLCQARKEAGQVVTVIEVHGLGRAEPMCGQIAWCLAPGRVIIRLSLSWWLCTWIVNKEAHKPCGSVACTAGKCLAQGFC